MSKYVKGTQWFINKCYTISLILKVGLLLLTILFLFHQNKFIHKTSVRKIETIDNIRESDFITN